MSDQSGAPNGANPAELDSARREQIADDASRNIPAVVEQLISEATADLGDINDSWDRQDEEQRVLGMEAAARVINYSLNIGASGGLSGIKLASRMFDESLRSVGYLDQQVDDLQERKGIVKRSTDKREIEDFEYEFRNRMLAISGRRAVLEAVGQPLALALGFSVDVPEGQELSVEAEAQEARLSHVPDLMNEYANRILESNEYEQAAHSKDKRKKFDLRDEADLANQLADRFSGILEEDLTFSIWTVDERMRNLIVNRMAITEEQRQLAAGRLADLPEFEGSELDDSGQAWEQSIIKELEIESKVLEFALDAIEDAAYPWPEENLENPASV